MKAILACDNRGGIGFNGAMPWPKQSKDLGRFKMLTTGTTVLMGRGTWDSTGMPKPLPDRKNVVASTQKLLLPDGVEQITDLDTADLTEIVWCIGGSTTINAVWDNISEFHITRLRDEYECDTFLDIDRLSQDFFVESSLLCLTHNYEIWKRR